MRFVVFKSRQEILSASIACRCDFFDDDDTRVHIELRVHEPWLIEGDERAQETHDVD